MAEEQVKQDPSYADALKSSMNTDFNRAVANQSEPVENEPAKNEELKTETKVEPKVENAPAFDAATYLKQTFGDEYADPEIIKSKISAKAPEPIVKQPEFANEESKQLYELVAAGKTKEVKQFLDDQAFYSSVNEMKDEQVIKEYWRKEIGLSQAQADKKFDREYKVKDADLLEDDEKETEEKFVAKKMATDAGQFRQELSAKSKEISLPSIGQPAPASAQQDDSPEAKNAASYAAELNKNVPVDVNKIEWGFNDEKSDLKIKGQVMIPENEISTIKSKFAGHEEKFLVNRWFNQDGSAKEDLIAADIYYLTNREKVINAGISDAVHQTRIELQKQNRNYQAPGGTVIQGEFEPSETEKKRAFYQKHYM